MAQFSFSIADIGFRITGPTAVVDLLNIMYGAFPPASGGATVDVSLDWNGTRCSVEKGARFVRVPREEHAVQVTPILVAGELHRVRPDLVILHGNALLDKTKKQPVLLIGESGAGKTTLTRELSRLTSTLCPLAEDVILIDTLKHHFLPFPRAASLRGGDEMLPAWAGLGQSEQRKRLSEARDFSSDPANLRGAFIFLLGHREGFPSGGPEKKTHGETVWLTCLPAGLVYDYETCGLPAAEILNLGSFPGIKFSRKLTSMEFSFLSEAATYHEALILRVEQGAQKLGPYAFRSEPSSQPVDLGNALPEFLPHLVRTGTDASLPGKDVMLLAAVFEGAAVWRFLPGGTPEESAREILRLIS